ncbi:MAG: transcriptional regulator NrdR [Gemmatimonadota bacterium]
MRCPRCDSDRNRVVDTRTSRGGRAVRRRRECLECAFRFTTYEYVEARPIQVLKRDGSSEEFDRGKLLRAIQTACAKRPVSMERIDELVDAVEDLLSKQAGLEVPSQSIGEMVMEALKPLDRVAYVRFASVYRDFQDEDEFQNFVVELKEKARMELEREHQSELPL